MPLQYISPEAVIEFIKPNQRVFIQGSAATPIKLIKTLLEYKNRFSNVELVSITLQGIELNPDEIRGHFFINSLFVSQNVREAVNTDTGDYVPVFLSEIPMLFREQILPLDVAIVHVSPPDEHGYCSLGTSVDIARAAVDTAKIILAQVNPNIPRTHGDGFIHMKDITAACYVEDTLPEVNYANKINDRTLKIGSKVAELIEDGATLQLGIGNIPDAVLKMLGNHKNLGLHTEMFSDGVIPLIESGVINNSCKKILAGQSVTSFAIGTKKLYNFLNNHPMIKFLDVAYVNDPRVLSLNPKVTAINSAIEIDLTGQVCADSIGHYQYSGIGGQMDFIRGAALSKGGKPIIVLPSTTGKGISKIVPNLKKGAGVVTTRGHIHWVITEFGAINLFGKNMSQRAKALISIAHPDHRETLERIWRDRLAVTV